ncbi:hypothetical protein ACX0HA_05035 [Flavobacterium hauense]
MHTFLLLVGFFTTMLFFLIDNNMLPGITIAQKYIITKLEKNKRKELELQLEFEKLINSYQAWSLKAFPDEDITYREYIELLKEKSSIEYSDAEFSRLKSKLKKNQLLDYIDKIKNQEEAVIALQANIACQKKNLQLLTVAKAS